MSFQQFLTNGSYLIHLRLLQWLEGMSQNVELNEMEFGHTMLTVGLGLA